MAGSDVVDFGFARVDVGREARQRLPEVVYGSGKTPAQVIGIVRILLGHNNGPVLVTRVEAEPEPWPAAGCTVPVKAGQAARSAFAWGCRRA